MPRPAGLYTNPKFVKGICDACRHDHIIDTSHKPPLCIECCRVFRNADQYACSAWGIRLNMSQSGIPLGGHGGSFEGHDPDDGEYIAKSPLIITSPSPMKLASDQ